jgi:hypothetical protein
VRPRTRIELLQIAIALCFLFVSDAMAQRTITEMIPLPADTIGARTGSDILPPILSKEGTWGYLLHITGGAINFAGHIVVTDPSFARSPYFNVSDYNWFAPWKFGAPYPVELYHWSPPHWETKPILCQVIDPYGLWRLFTFSWGGGYRYIQADWVWTIEDGDGGPPDTCRAKSPPFWRQGADSPWADSAYSKKPGLKMKDDGCAVTSLAMAMAACGDTVDPQKLNQWMRSRHRDLGGYDSASVNWRAPNFFQKSRFVDVSTVYHETYKKSRGAWEVDKKDLGFTMGDIDLHLRRCRHVIARVYNPNSVRDASELQKEDARRNGNHWVLIRGYGVGPDLSTEYTLNDPGRGSKYLSNYNYPEAKSLVYRYVVIECR